MRPPTHFIALEHGMIMVFVSGSEQSWKCTSAKGTGQCFSALVPQALKH